jgi:cytoskeletal protein CcmA (bactofilin family)
MSVWNMQRREQEPDRPLNGTPRSMSPVPPVEIRKETTPLSSMPTGRQDSDAAGSGSASIGKAVKIVGQIFSCEDLFVDGDVEGTIELVDHKLTVGPNGKVHSGIKAREVVALGAIEGNVEVSDRIEIRKNAKLVGDIKTSRIVIEDGAYFKGSIDIGKAGPKVIPAQPRQAAAAAASGAPVAVLGTVPK